MAELLPLPIASFADLRRLYEAPHRLGEGLGSETLARLFELTRLVLGAERVGLLLAGDGAMRGDALGLDPADLNLAAPCVRGGLTLLPLRVPLLPSGLGASRVFGVLAAGPSAPEWEGKAALLARQAEASLVLDAIGRASRSDALTGLLTRPAFEQVLPSVAQTVGEGGRVALLMLDVDDLRAVNATRGYRGGDDLLRLVAAAVQGEVPQGAVTCRYGGDEMAVLLLDTTVEAAVQLGERLVGGVVAATALGGATPPSVSVGVACAPDHGDAGEDLVFRADQALARAKELGKARVVIWSEELRTRRWRDRLAGILTGDSARDYRNVEALLETVREVSHLAPLEETLTCVVDRLIEVAGAERGVLLLRDPKGGWATRIARSGGRNLEGAAQLSTSAVDEAWSEGRAVFRLSKEGAPLSPSAEVLGLKAVLCAPLVGEDVPEGVVYVDARATVARFDRPTIAFFGALAAELGAALRNANLYERLLDRARRLEADVADREQALARFKRFWAKESTTRQGYEELVGASPAMQEVFNLLRTLETSLVPVLIEGESGTGKELVARAIHKRSERSAGPFVAESCATIAEGLFERELFGHVQGAFTGAHADRAGLLDAADGGTFFLDEVGELPLSTQGKLLRVLQEGELRRVGDTRVRTVDVRVVAATNRSLRAMAEAGTFREDLYYRLAVFKVDLPPLRERPTDIPLLADHLLEELAKARGIDVPVLSPRALEELVGRTWRGNVRELRNVFERAATLSAGGPIQPEHLAPEEAGPPPSQLDALYDLPLQKAKNAFAAVYVRRLVEREGSIAAAARRASASRQTIYRLLEEAGSSEAAEPEA